MTLYDNYKLTFSAYRASFVRICSVSLITHVCTYVLLFTLGISVFTSIASIRDAAALFQLQNPYTYLVLLLIVLIAAIQLIGFIALIYMVMHPKETTVLDAFQHALRYMGRFIVLSIVIAAMILLGLCIGYIVAVLIGIVIERVWAGSINYVFGWLTLIPFFTSVLTSMFFVFSLFSLIDHTQRITDALRESYQLTRTHLGLVVSHLFFLYGSVGLVSIAFSIIPRVGEFLFLTLVTPFSIIYLYILYTALARQSQLSNRKTTS